jgi:tetratricopeptide (TPR) repeat protein
VLKLDPHNQQAQAGMQEIANRIEQQARAKQRQEQYEDGLKMITQGLVVAPKHSGLLALQKELTQQLEEKRRRHEVARLLAKAEQQLAASHLMEPADDNANASYRKVLELDPQNTQAKTGLGRIAEQFEQSARQRQAEGSFKESLAAIEQGLQVLPEHPGLQALRTEVQGQLEAQARQRAEQARRQREVAQLLAQAEQQLKASQLIKPTNDNAYASYHKVLELDPGNAGAQAGLEKIAALLERRAAQRRDEGLFQESLTLAEHGLRAFPDHTGLQALRAEVQSQIEAQARRRQEVQRLLAEAERQMNASQLIKPANDNANASYRKVLELDPDNAQAKAGLGHIAGHFEQLARQRQAEGSFKESLAAIEQGLQVLPEHKGLQALRTEVQAQLEAQARQRAEQERRRLEVARLLAQAERQVKASQLIEPANDNANASYRKVLELDPDNAQAKAGLGHIAGHFEQLARQRQAEGSFKESLAAIEQGLQVLPEHKGLQALRTEVKAQLEAQARQRAEQERRQREVARLLAQAERQFANSKLALPEGDNALATYQSILALDSRNEKARQGLQAIAEHFEKQARRNQNEGRLIAALVAINTGLKAVPDDSNLLELQKTIKQSLDEKVRRQRLLSKLEAVAKAHMSASHYTQPDGENAFQTFKEMLTIDPDNRVALEGLAKIVRYYEQSAQEQYRKGHFAQSSSLAEAGLKVQAKNAVLITLRKDSITQLETQRQQRRVDELFATAEEQLASSKLLEPQGNNAYESYRQILELSPDNRRARAGLQQIADQFLQRGQAKLKEGKPKESLALINQGLSVIPEHPGLLDLRGTVIKQTRNKSTDKALERLLSEADQQLADLYLTTPKGNNAYESYQQVLKISPNNPRARAGLQHIADRYYELGKASLESGSFEDSLKFIDRGLLVAANHSALLDLRADVQRKLEEETNRQQALQRLIIEAQQQYRAGDLRHALATITRGLKIEPTHSGLLRLQKEVEKLAGKKRLANEKKRLLAKAQEKLEANQLLHPAGDNAFEIYQKVLKLDPQNPQAHEGLQMMVKRYETRARAKQQEGDLNESLSLIERGLKIDPDHRGLLKLQATLTEQLESEREQNKRDDQPTRRRGIFGSF